MKHLFILPALLLIGCNNTDKIDTSFRDDPKECPAPVIPEPCPVCPEPEKSINGFIDDITDYIDVNNVKMEHYVDEVKIDDNIATLYDINGSVATKNKIIMPPYIGKPMRHVLIVEFYQIGDEK